MDCFVHKKSGKCLSRCLQIASYVQPAVQNPKDLFVIHHKWQRNSAKSWHLRICNTADLIFWFIKWLKRLVSYQSNFISFWSTDLARIVKRGFCSQDDVMETVTVHHMSSERKFTLNMTKLFALSILNTLSIWNYSAQSCQRPTVSSLQFH